MLDLKDAKYDVAKISGRDVFGQITTAFTGDLHCAASLRSAASFGA